MSNSKNDYIIYRLKRADETLNEAKFMFENGMYHGSINRIYYSCYYAVLALMITKDFNSKTHKGISILFHQHFIKTEILPKELGLFFSQMFNVRQENDYQDFIEIETEILPQWLGQAEQFLQIIKEHINAINL
jgi:uncharacterized protein (UPF0332 family)